MTAAQTDGYNLDGARWALEAIRNSLQEKVEQADWMLRTAAEREGRPPRDPAGSGLLRMYEQAHGALDRARSSVEIYANHPLPARDRERRKEEAAALSQRVQTAMDNETRPSPGFRQLNVQFRAEEAVHRARDRGRQHPVPSLTKPRARTPRPRGKEGRP